MERSFHDPRTHRSAHGRDLVRLLFTLRRGRSSHHVEMPPVRSERLAVRRRLAARGRRFGGSGVLSDRDYVSRLLHPALEEETMRALRTLSTCLALALMLTAAPALAQG